MNYKKIFLICLFLFGCTPNKANKLESAHLIDWFTQIQLKRSEMEKLEEERLIAQLNKSKKVLCESLSQDNINILVKELESNLEIVDDLYQLIKDTIGNNEKWFVRLFVNKEFNQLNSSFENYNKSNETYQFAKKHSEPGSEPSYNGAQQLTLQYVGMYKGKIVATGSGIYFSIDTELQLRVSNVFRGYFISTGEMTFLLELGRPAFILKLTDEFQYQVDQEKYQRELDAWKKGVQESRKFKAQLPKLRKQREGDFLQLLIDYRTWLCKE